MESSFDVTETKCPACTKNLNAAAPVNGKRSPSPGDISVCFNCGEWLFYVDSLALRLMTEEEKVGLDQITKHILKQMSTLISMKNVNRN